jgi:hypothetical protein
MLVRWGPDRWLAYPRDWSGWEVGQLCSCAEIEIYVNISEGKEGRCV